MSSITKRRITRREFLKGIGAAAGVGLLHALIPDQAAQAAFIFVRGNPNLSFMSLTYDDCYDIEVLQGMADLLEENPKVKVSFFPTGTALLFAQEHAPDLWPRLAKRGHDIGYHSFSHTDMRTMTHDQVTADYNRWLDVLEETLGKKPVVRFARPPYGAMSNSFSAMCAKYDLVVAWWSVLWGEPLSVVQPKIEKAARGDIVLFHMLHDDLTNTINALPQLKLRGMKLVTLTNLYRAYTDPDFQLNPGDDPALWEGRAKLL